MLSLSWNLYIALNTQFSFIFHLSNTQWTYFILKFYWNIYCDLWCFCERVYEILAKLHVATALATWRVEFCNVYRKCHKFQRNFLIIVAQQNHFLRFIFFFWLWVFFLCFVFFFFCFILFFVLFGFDNTFALFLSKNSLFYPHAYANRFDERRGGEF